MKNDLRCKLPHGAIELDGVSYIPTDVVHQRTDACGSEQIWISGRVERVAADKRAQPGERKTQPTAFESGMPGNKYSSPGEHTIHHVFHGAFPEFHSSSNCCLSRSVSIGCQKS